jgi:hypothetical protein
MEFLLRVVVGEPRGLFPGEHPRRAPLLSHFLEPPPCHTIIFLWETQKVDGGRSEGWKFDNSDVHLT